LLQDLLEPAHHVCGLPPVAPAPHAQVVIRPGDVEGIEEHVGHVLVVMLARVDQDLLMVLTDLAAHRRGLDELGSRADDARDFHAASDGSGGLLALWIVLLLTIVDSCAKCPNINMSKDAWVSGD